MIDQEFQRVVPHEKFTSLHRCILAGLIIHQVTKAKSLTLSCVEKRVLSRLCVRFSGYSYLLYAVVGA